MADLLVPEQSFLLKQLHLSPSEQNQATLHRCGAVFWLDLGGETIQFDVRSVQCLDEDIPSEEFKFRLEGDSEQIVYSCASRQLLIDTLLAALAHISSLEQETNNSNNSMNSDDENFIDVNQLQFPAKTNDNLAPEEREKISESFSPQRRPVTAVSPSSSSAKTSKTSPSSLSSPVRSVTSPNRRSTNSTYTSPNKYKSPSRSPMRRGLNSSGSGSNQTTPGKRSIGNGGLSGPEYTSISPTRSQALAPVAVYNEETGLAYPATPSSPLKRPPIPLSPSSRVSSNDPGSASKSYGRASPGAYVSPNKQLYVRGEESEGSISSSSSPFKSLIESPSKHIDFVSHDDNNNPSNNPNNPPGDLKQSLTEFAATYGSSARVSGDSANSGSTKEKNTLLDVIDVWEEKAVTRPIPSVMGDAQVQRTFKVFKQFRIGWVKGRKPSTRWRTVISSVLRAELESTRAQLSSSRQDAKALSLSNQALASECERLRAQYYLNHAHLSPELAQKQQDQLVNIGEHAQEGDEEEKDKLAKLEGLWEKGFESYLDDTNISAEDRLAALRGRYLSLKQQQTTERELFLKYSAPSPSKISKKNKSPVKTNTPSKKKKKHSSQTAPSGNGERSEHGSEESESRARELTVRLADSLVKQTQCQDREKKVTLALNTAETRLAETIERLVTAEEELGSARSVSQELEHSLITTREDLETKNQMLAEFEKERVERDEREGEYVIRLGQQNQSLTQLKGVAHNVKHMFTD